MTDVEKLCTSVTAFLPLWKMVSKSNICMLLLNYLRFRVTLTFAI